MSFIDLSMISIALGLDAFGVALSIGLDKKITRKKAMAFIISFGFFQFLFASIGGITGNMFNKYIFHLPSVIGGIIILLVGLLMFREGSSNQGKIIKMNCFMIILLGICVSIDALVVGFSTFNDFNISELILNNTVVIGIITSFLTLNAFVISRKAKKNEFIKKYADFLAGIILIIFGLKMIIF
ncbi:manganese efflux pump MntP family protein [Brassicibacter mesophilus]|uniref:manganese efflux pump MntP n=1 Tax=Brassicibacter mesophilus TaxID=745119 RepID=UPI003D1FE8E5